MEGWKELISDGEGFVRLGCCRIGRLVSMGSPGRVRYQAIIHGGLAMQDCLFKATYFRVYLLASTQSIFLRFN